MEPSLLPGATLLRLRPSSGETKPVRLSNIRMLTTGTAMTAPHSVADSIDWTIRITASIGAYSVACTPDVRHSVGPSCAPFTITTGNWIGPDAVSPMVMNPLDFCPGSAVIPRMRTAAFIARASLRVSCDRRGGAAGRHRAVRGRETANAVVDFIGGGVTVRD